MTAGYSTLKGDGRGWRDGSVIENIGFSTQIGLPAPTWWLTTAYFFSSRGLGVSDALIWPLCALHAHGAQAFLSEPSLTHKIQMITRYKRRGVLTTAGS